MWGGTQIQWFELFAGIAIYRMTEAGPDNRDGWLNVTDIEKRFKLEQLKFNGSAYDSTNESQRNALLDTIITNASILCEVGVLERRRNISPPSLDYRVTKLGRRVDSWGHGTRPGIRKRIFFLAFNLYFRSKRLWKFVIFGAGAWALLNAIKFYTIALDWIRDDVFPAISAIVVIIVAWLIQWRR